MKEFIIKIYKIKNIDKWLCLIAVSLVFLIIACNAIYGEHTPKNVNEGLGWDGKVYAKITERIPHIEYPPYLLARIFPAVIVHYGAKIFGHPISMLNPEGIIHAYCIYNFAFLLFGVVILFLTARAYKWSLPVFLIVFASIFINYPVLKLAMYHPNSTDISAMMMGLLIFYLYSTDKTLLFFIASFFGSFTFPPSFFLISPLLLFKVQKIQIPLCKPNKFANLSIGIISTFLIGAIALPVILGITTPPLFESMGAPSKFTLIISTIFLISYLFLALRQFFDLDYIISQLKYCIKIPYIITGVSLFITIKLLMCYFYLFELDSFFQFFRVIIGLESAGSPFNGCFHFFRLITYSALKYPLANIIAHVTYYGPVGLLIMFFWNDFVRVVKEKGLGVMLFIVLSIFLLIGSESRQDIFVIPTFAILLGEVMNRHKVSLSFAGLFAIIGLIYSRFWLQHPEADQLFFMNFGPYMSNIAYTIFLALTILLAIILWFLKSRYWISSTGEFKNKFVQVDSQTLVVNP